MTGRIVCACELLEGVCVFIVHIVYNQCLPSVNLSGTNTQTCCLSAFVNRCLNWAFHLSVTSNNNNNIFCFYSAFLELKDALHYEGG